VADLLIFQTNSSQYLLRRKRMSLRKISAALADAGHLNERGRLFNQRSIKVMVEG
jgi:hypothetical protein